VFMTQNLTTQRELLHAIHDRLRRIADRHEAGNVLAELGTAERRLAETTFRLVVLGEYKRGKSTLINALLGKPVLPMAVVPLTSIVTEVRYRDDPGITVEFLDGRTKEIRPAELAGFVTEPENPRNSKQVRRATVHDSSPLLKEGVAIVDTPGVGSVFQHNSEITYRFLEESDAVVMVLAADQPLSSEEHDLLKALTGVTKRILFAVNRVDVLTDGDAAESLRFIRETLAVMDQCPPDMVFPISARDALQARVQGSRVPETFASFEAALYRVLIRRKGDILIERSWTITRAAADTLALRVRSERQALELAGDRLRHATEAFHSAAAAIQERTGLSGVLLRHQVERIHSVELRSTAVAARVRIAAALWPRIEAVLDSESTPLLRRVTALTADIGTWVVDELNRYYPDTEALVHRSLSHALEEHMARVQTAMGEVVEQANQLLGMRAEVPVAVAPLSEHPHFYLRDWDYAGGRSPARDWRLRLPRRWAEARARERLRELLERRINQNLEAIRYDWVMRLDDAARRFQTSSEEQLTTIVKMISEALDRAEHLREGMELDGRKAELDRDLEAIAALRASLGSSTPAVPDPDDGNPSGHDRP